MRSRTLFLLAIVMGLITTLVFAYSFSAKNKESDLPIVTKEVVVSVQAIEENTVITKEMVKLATRPTSSVHASSLTSLKDVVGKLATTRIEADEVLLPARVQSPQEVEDMVSKKITDGQRAISIRANLVQSVSNLIEAEDFVDIIYSVTEDEATTNKPVTKSVLLFSKVRVLAVGQKMTVKDENDVLVEYASVTLEISPEDMIQLIQAHETDKASLHLTLHRREVLPPKE
ncbi:MAG: Flp pilus assembly protein CpaB [Paenisporosarcina sp.]